MTEHLSLIGTVGTEPGARALATGDTVTSFRLASSKRVKDPQSGQWRDGETSWFTISAWNGLGQNVHDSIRKGDRVVVTGRLKVRDWENDERKGTEVEVVADGIGHDLKWGTSRFIRAPKETDAAAERGDVGPPSTDGAAGGDGDAWAVPLDAEAEPATPY